MREWKLNNLYFFNNLHQGNKWKYIERLRPHKKKKNNGSEITFHKFNCLNTCARTLVELRYRWEIIQSLKQPCNYNTSNELAVTNQIAWLSGAEWWFFKWGVGGDGGKINCSGTECVCACVCVCVSVYVYWPYSNIINCTSLCSLLDSLLTARCWHQG